jgi:hypothetical protein
LCWSAVHISSLFTIREQISFGSAGLIAGSFRHLNPEEQRLTGIEEARSAGDFADSISLGLLTVFLKWPIFLYGK